MNKLKAWTLFGLALLLPSTAGFAYVSERHSEKEEGELEKAEFRVYFKRGSKNRFRIRFEVEKVLAGLVPAEACQNEEDKDEQETETETESEETSSSEEASSSDDGTHSSESEQETEHESEHEAEHENDDCDGDGGLKRALERALAGRELSLSVGGSTFTNVFGEDGRIRDHDFRAKLKDGGEELDIEIRGVELAEALGLDPENDGRDLIVDVPVVVSLGAQPSNTTSGDTADPAAPLVLFDETIRFEYRQKANNKAKGEGEIVSSEDVSEGDGDGSKSLRGRVTKLNYDLGHSWFCT